MLKACYGHNCEFQGPKNGHREVLHAQSVMVEKKLWEKYHIIIIIILIIIIIIIIIIIVVVVVVIIIIVIVVVMIATTTTITPTNSAFFKRNRISPLTFGSRDLNKGHRRRSPSLMIMPATSLTCLCVHFPGKMYVAGGFDGTVRHTSTECYDATIDQWALVGEMLIPREGAGMANVDDVLYCVGGFDGDSVLNSAERFDPRTGQWVVIAPMGTRRSGGARGARPVDWETRTRHDLGRHLSSRSVNY